MKKFKNKIKFRISRSARSPWTTVWRVEWNDSRLVAEFNDKKDSLAVTNRLSPKMQKFIRRASKIFQRLNKCPGDIDTKMLVELSNL
jgi:hypothetical protein